MLALRYTLCSGRPADCEHGIPATL